MVNFERGKVIKYYFGSKSIRSHIDAVHAVTEFFTGEIVEGVIKKINCHGIVGTVSRTVVDLNRFPNNQNKEAIEEYRLIIKHILKHLDVLDKDDKLVKPYLHLAIHGIKDSVHGPNVIEIGTRDGETCSSEVKEWFIKELNVNGFEIQIDTKKIGDPSKIVHRWGDNVSDLYYSGYGENFNTLQIEISRTLREKYRNEFIGIFSEIIRNFNETFK